MYQNPPHLAVVIMAAGKGTRMKSELAKVLHPLAGRPLLHYALDLAGELGAERTVVVVGHQAPAVQEAAQGFPSVRFALQEPQLGTGHAMQAALPGLAGHQGPVLVLYGDVPGLRAATLRRLWEAHHSQGLAMTVLAMELPDPGHYGRLVREPGGGLCRIVEFRDASPAERTITLVNSGIYLFEATPLREGLSQLRPDNDQGEYYLTDLVEILHRGGWPVGFALCPDAWEVAGINSQEELAAYAARLSSAQGS
ncbi:MAG: NTP transferase domain-containing protein [Deltaproteobacteria bacterium]|nr:NTP transferase domain-containing protein [Deltaproteobacteria bacterium]